MSVRLRLSRAAQQDLARLFDFVLERAPARDGGDLLLAERALEALRAGLATLRSSPFTCRKAGASPFLRALVMAFGHQGDVALFELEGTDLVTVLAVRHQRDDDLH